MKWIKIYMKRLYAIFLKKKEKKIKRFLRYEDSLKTLIGEVLIRKIIMTKLKLANDEIILKTNEFGKPYLENYDEFHF